MPLTLEKSRYFPAFLIALALAVAALLGAAMWSLTGGHLMAPLDDTFILANYAKNLARGHWFEYSPGQGYSSGSTSFLYPLILAPFFWAGFSGVKILLVTFAIGAAGLIVTALALLRLGEALGSPRAGRWAALLFLLNGHAAWGYLCGMETALYSTLIVLALLGFQQFFAKRQSPALWWGAGFLALAALTRLEGAVLLLGLWILILLRLREKSLPPRTARAALAAVVPFGLIMLMSAALTGSLSSNTMASKGLLSHPYLSAWDMGAQWAQNILFIWAGHFTNTIAEPMFQQFRGAPLWYVFPPLALLLFVIGAGAGAANEWHEGRAAGWTLLILWMALLMGALALVENPFVHNFRYFVPLTPLLILGAAAGIDKIGSLFKTRRSDAAGMIALLLVILALPSLLFWAREYGENAGDIYNQHRRLSWWVADATPPEALIGVTDAGLIPYYTDRAVFDFVGLVSNGQARYWREGMGTTFERIEKMEGRLPDYIITYSYLWGEPHFLGEKIYQMELASNSVTSGKALEVWRPDWSILNSGESPLDLDALRGGWRIMDILDVGDLEAEAGHEYSWAQDAERVPPSAWPPRANLFNAARYESGALVADGGRAISGRESFVMKCKPGVEARLILRTDAAAGKRLKVFIDGDDVGDWEIPAAGRTGWREVWFDLPAQRVKNDKMCVTLQYDWDHAWEHYHHSYHYWLVQKDGDLNGH